MPTIAFACPFARTLSLAAVVGLATGCASPAPSSTQLCQGPLAAPHDPAEQVNRGIFAFNRSLDDYLLAPVARGYRHLSLIHI